MIRIFDYLAPKAVEKEEELAGLTGLRGIAALMVFIYHLPWLAGFKSENWWSVVPGTKWMNACDAGVGLFFALSAFLLSRPFWQFIQSGHSIKGKIEPFLIRRFCRIFPAYWVVVAFSFLFDIVRGGRSLCTAPPDLLADQHDPHRLRLNRLSFELQERKRCCVRVCVSDPEKLSALFRFVSTSLVTCLQVVGCS